jgi:hypothetical protein
MSSAELTEWMAYERVYGPILIHDRIDVGFLLLQQFMAYLWTKTRQQRTMQDFMPPWIRELAKDATRRPDAIRSSFEALMEMAENAND